MFGHSSAWLPSGTLPWLSGFPEPSGKTLPILVCETQRPQLVTWLLSQLDSTCCPPLSQGVCMWPTMSLQLELHPPRDPGPTLNRCPVPGPCHPSHGSWAGQVVPRLPMWRPHHGSVYVRKSHLSPRSDASWARPGLWRTRSPDRSDARLRQLHPHATSCTRGPSPADTWPVWDSGLPCHV